LEFLLSPSPAFRDDSFLKKKRRKENREPRVGGEMKSLSEKKRTGEVCLSLSHSQFYDFLTFLKPST